MLTKNVKNRILFLIFIFLLSVIVIFFIIKSLNKNILYFSSPTEIKQREDIPFGKAMRVGGMVKKGSITISSKDIQFIVTDFENEILISYSGTVPNLFKEEKGVVAEGKLSDKNFFIADRILAKHDENYMPPEIKEIIEKNAK
ncbi:cytochrome c maturation protein CcmE [Pelagibacteraceae bacterium]|nr:cytochrome c maturation protein CcmE [Pelagibacteraceae bacterium]|tara:strand:+ start:31 stop:459 length:429 start_codon:yes stop_codon:yes gene_type:complete